MRRIFFLNLKHYSLTLWYK